MYHCKIVSRFLKHNIITNCIELQRTVLYIMSEIGFENYDLTCNNGVWLNYTQIQRKL